MSTDSGKADRPPEAGSGHGAAPRPFWIGAGLIAFGAVWVHGGLSLPQGARYAVVGPGLTPALIGCVLILLGVILIVQIWRGERFEPQDSEDAAAGSPMDSRAFFIALAAVFLPVATLPRLGLPITAALAFMLVTRALGSTRYVANFIIGGVIGGISWLLFTRLGLQLGQFFPPLGF